MHKWNLRLLMNNGKTLDCYCRCTETGEHTMLRKVFGNRRDNEFISLDSLEDDRSMYVRFGDISAVIIFH